jgi:uncharacterized protein YkwD
MRTSITKRLALISSIPAFLLGLVMVASPAQAATADVAKITGDIVYLTNKQRELHGCKPLHVDARLTASATGHSAYMAQSGAFSHIGRGGSDFVYREKAAHFTTPSAENIAYGYRTGLDVMKGWLASPEHRANLLNCKSTQVGVGAVFAANGTPYYTQDFGY